MFLVNESLPLLVVLGMSGYRNALGNSVIGKIDQVGELVQGQVVSVPGVARSLFQVVSAKVYLVPGSGAPGVLVSLDLILP